MTDPTSQKSTTARAYGPWCWLGQRQTSAFTAFTAACAAAGVEVVDPEDRRATVCVIDMLTAASLDPVSAGQDGPVLRLLLASSPEDVLLARPLGNERDEVEMLDTPAEALILRLMRMDRRPSA